jgi:transposase
MTWIPKQLTRKQIEERRLAGGKLLKEGRLSKAQIAHKLGVSRAAVTYWARRKRFGGLRRLQSRQSSGRPPKLTPQQQRTLLGYLKRGGIASRFSYRPLDVASYPARDQKGIRYSVSSELPRSLLTRPWLDTATPCSSCHRAG